MIVANDISKWLNLARIDIKNKGEGNNVKVTVLEGGIAISGRQAGFPRVVLGM